MSNKIISSKVLSSKSNIPSDLALPRQYKNNSNSKSRLNDSMTNKSEKIKNIKTRTEKSSQELTSVIYQKDKAIQKLQQQLEKERTDNEKLKNKVEHIVKQKQSIKGKNQRPQTASAANYKKRESNQEKNIEELRISKKSQNSITSLKSRKRSSHENINSNHRQEVNTSKLSDKEKLKQEQSQLILTLTEYEFPSEQIIGSKGSNNKYNGCSPLNNNENGYQSYNYDHQRRNQYNQQCKTYDQNHLNNIPPEKTQYQNQMQDKNASENQNQTSIMQNKVIQNALSAKNQQNVWNQENQKVQSEEQKIIKNNFCKTLDKESTQKFKSLDYKNTIDNQNQQVSSFLPNQDNYLNKYQDSNNYYESEQRERHFQLNNNKQQNRITEITLQDQLEKKFLNHSDLQQQQYSAQSFGIQPKSDLRQSINNDDYYQLNFDTDDKYRNFYQSEPTSLKNGNKKVTENREQLYQLQQQKHESETEKLRKYIMILKDELKEKKQETIQKEIKYKRELNNLQSMLSAIERDNKNFEQREQQTQDLIQQLKMKEDEIESIKQFYEDKLQNEQQQFHSTKKIWQNIYRELSEEINILKHELNQYNVSLIDEQINDSKQADNQYINFRERYN